MSQTAHGGVLSLCNRLQHIISAFHKNHLWKRLFGVLFSLVSSFLFV